jgi:hypothetical protein
MGLVPPASLNWLLIQLRWLTFRWPSNIYTLWAPPVSFYRCQCPLNRLLIPAASTKWMALLRLACQEIPCTPKRVANPRGLYTAQGRPAERQTLALNLQPYSAPTITPITSPGENGRAGCCSTVRASIQLSHAHPKARPGCNPKDLGISPK